VEDEGKPCIAVVGEDVVENWRFYEDVRGACKWLYGLPDVFQFRKYSLMHS